MIAQPFSATAKAQASIEAYLRKMKLVLADHTVRTIELTSQTNVLISLLFNIATLQDTRATIEESKATNRLASSIKRLTVLTFVYLPLSLAAVSFGLVYFVSRLVSRLSVRVCLPMGAVLLLASQVSDHAIFGMNVQGMSEEDRNPPWWSFLVLASGLASVTVAI